MGNQSGSTWEDKHYHKWAQERLEQMCMDISYKAKWGGSSCKVQVTSIEKCKGEFSIIFSRGKKRVVVEFELKLRLFIVAEDGEQTTYGNFHIPEITGDDLDDDDDDLEVAVTCDDRSLSSQFKSASSPTLSHIR